MSDSRHAAFASVVSMTVVMVMVMTVSGLHNNHGFWISIVGGLSCDYLVGLLLWVMVGVLMVVMMVTFFA